MRLEETVNKYCFWRDSPWTAEELFFDVMDVELRAFNRVVFMDWALLECEGDGWKLKQQYMSLCFHEIDEIRKLSQEIKRVGVEYVRRRLCKKINVTKQHLPDGPGTGSAWVTPGRINKPFG